MGWISRPLWLRLDLKMTVGPMSVKIPLSKKGVFMMTDGQYGRFPGSTKRISRVVQGTASIDRDDKEGTLALFDAVYALGCRAFDTAHTYSGGYSERFLGEWLTSRGLHDEVFVVSKCGHPNADRSTRITPFDMESDLHDSLARLQTETIDLYLLHRDDETRPVSEIVDLFNRFIDEGKIRAYGGSNWTAARMQAANAYAAANGLQGMRASSPQFSLAVPVKPPWPGCLSVSGAPGQSDRAWYAENDIPLITWSSLASGFFSGRFTPDNLETFSYWVDQVCAETYCTDDNFKRLQRAEQLGVEKGMSVAQIALAYVLNQPGPVFAIVASRTPEEYEMNIKATGRLTAAEISRLENGDEI